MKTTYENFHEATPEDRLQFLIDTADDISDPLVRATRDAHIAVMLESIAERGERDRATIREAAEHLGQVLAR
jgi:hypothetical protein